MALQFRTLLTRTLTAAVFVGILLTCILYDYISFTLLFFIVSIWGLVEFYRIAEKLGAMPFKVSGIIAGSILYLCGILFAPIPFFTVPLYFSGVIFFLLFIVALFSSREKPVLDLVYTVAGIVYVVMPFVFLNRLGCVSDHYDANALIHRFSGYNAHFILGPILLIWANDTFAYLSGSLLGRHKLYEKISPGKTWEGSIGGAILTLASVYLIAKWYPELSYFNWIVIAGIVILFGTLGDLIESMLKRQAGIKDSGRIMPGHGGILDRFDSLLFSTPFVYFYLEMIF